MAIRSLTNEPLFIDTNQANQTADFSFAQDRTIIENQPLFVQSQSTPQTLPYEQQDIIGKGLSFLKTQFQKSQEAQEKLLLEIAPGVKIDPFFGVGGLQKVGVKAVQKAPSVFKGFKDLTLKTLERLKGKSTTSKQEILDFSNMPELKQAERDLIRNVVEEMSPSKKVFPSSDIINK